MESPKRRITFDPNIEKASKESKEQRIRDMVSTIFNDSPKNTKEVLSQQLLYLDLSSTPINNVSLSNLSPNLAVLRLTGIPIRNQKIPMMKHLRTLFLDSCKISSLENFPQLPNIKYLNLSNNRISTFKGLPVLPTLETLDLRDNKVYISTEVALAAFGSISLNVYNGDIITEAQIRKAFRKSPIYGVALRKGLPLPEETEEEEIEEEDQEIDPEEIRANDFLTEDLQNEIYSQLEDIPPTYLIVDQKELTITLPFKASKIKWFMNRQPVGNEEWDLLKGLTKKRQENTLILTQMLHQHLIRAEFEIPEFSKSKRYSMYTINTIGSSKATLTLPFPINPKVTGEPIEGSLISLLPMPVPVHLTWKIGKQDIDNKSDSLKLDETHIGNEVSIILEPYCPNIPTVTFAKLITKTECVSVLPPTVTGVRFPEEPIEGIEMQFDHTVYPKREGNSIIYIERSLSPSGEWERIALLQKFSMVYTPRTEDLGFFLRISYLPILDDNTTTKDEVPFYFYSKSRVIPGLPRFTNPMIAGDMQCGHPIIAIADYTGGKKGRCVYNWFHSQQPLNDKRSFINQKHVHQLEENGPVLKLSKELEGRYIGVEMLPIRSDDTVGELVRTSCKDPIDPGERLTELRKLPTKIKAFINIDVGITVYWYRTSTDWNEKNGAKTGFEKMAVGPEYTPTEADVGRHLRLISKDGHCDTIIGPVLPSVPFIYNFNLEFESNSVGSVLSIPLKVLGRDDDSKSHRTTRIADEDLVSSMKVDIVWVRVSNTGYEKVIDVESIKYIAKPEDVGSKIKVVAYPIDMNDKRCEPTESALTPVITPLKLQPPIVKGDLRVGSTLSLEYDLPLYAVTWFKSKSNKWDKLISFKFDHVSDGNELVYRLSQDSQEEESDEDLRLEPSLVLQEEDVDNYIQAEVIVGEWRDDELVPLNQFPVVASQGMKMVQRCPFQIVLPKEVREGPLYEGQTVTLKHIGRTPENRPPKFVWEVMDEEDVWHERGQGISYTFVHQDVGSYFRVRYLPESKKYKGDDIFVELPQIITAGPTISDITLYQDDEGSVTIAAKYFGGVEGKSKIYVSFVSQTDKTTIVQVEIENPLRITQSSQTLTKFTPWRELFGKRIDVAYIPIRVDGTQGKCQWSENSIVIKPIPLIRNAFIMPPPNLFKIGVDLYVEIKQSSLAQSYQYIWYKYVSEKELDKKKGKKNAKPQKKYNEYDEEEEEEDREDTMVKQILSEEPTYTIQQSDSGATIYLSLKAVGKTGFLSPIYILKAPIKEFIETGYQVTIEIPERTIKEVKTNKRSSANMSKTAKVKGAVDTGDCLNAVISPELEEGEDASYTWQCSTDDTTGENPWQDMSSEPNFYASIAEVGRLIRVVCEIGDDEICSLPVGPVQINPVIESQAKAIIRADALRFKAKAPAGSGSWEIQFAGSGVTVKSRQGKITNSKWSEAKCDVVKGTKDQIDFHTGPASRFIMVPSLENDPRSGVTIPKDQVRDLIVFIFNNYKQKAANK